VRTVGITVLFSAVAVVFSQVLVISPHLACHAFSSEQVSSFAGLLLPRDCANSACSSVLTFSLRQAVRSFAYGLRSLALVRHAGAEPPAALRCLFRWDNRNSVTVYLLGVGCAHLAYSGQALVLGGGTDIHTMRH